MQRRYKSLISEILSLLLLALAVFSFIALGSYHSKDSSFFTVGHGPIHNACGWVGAQIAAFWLEFFGLGGFLFPAALIFLAVSTFRNEGLPRLVMTLAGMTVAVLSMTVFLTLQWPEWKYSEKVLLTGGAVGAALSHQLVSHLHRVGASIVSLLIFALAIAISTPISVADWSIRVLEQLWRGTKFFALRGGKVVLAYLSYLVGLALFRFGKWMSSQLKQMIHQSLSKPKIGFDKVESKVSESNIEDSQSIFVTNAEPPQSISSHIPKIEPLFKPDIPKTELKPPRLGSKPHGPWKLPTVEFLRKPTQVENSIDRDRLIKNSEILKQKFLDFMIDGEVTAVRPGPVITLYEFKPGPGVKVSQIARLADDLSMALSAQSVRILAPLPGRSVVGIEIPNENRETVFLREFIQHPDFHGSKHTIPVVMGKDIAGQSILSDLSRMPHLLCAGQTGSGKSVFMNSFICSLLYRFTPDELRMILVDPKFIEFRSYQDIPHLLLPVVDDPKHAAIALRWAVREMERRYRILARLGVRNLGTFNQKVEDMGSEVVRDLLMSEENQTEGTSAQSGTNDWYEAFEPDEQGAPKIGKLPNIVIIIDELADLMMVAKKEVEISIARIAQKARAAGIHLVIATQRPSTDVITGLIKANLPSRVSFQLASYVDSKTILDRSGAERLLGQGDMLFMPPGLGQLVRLHGALVEDEEISKITSFLKAQGKPVYREEILIDDENEDDLGDASSGDDELFQEAVELVKRSGHASASFIQRHLKVGYNRAARMIETMETRGIVGPADGARPREVLVR